MSSHNIIICRIFTACLTQHCKIYMHVCIRTVYVTPLSVPMSHGNRFHIRDSIQVQLGRHSSNPDIPTIQSGEGSILDTRDIRWWWFVTRNTAKVLPVRFGYDMPRALMMVLILVLWKFNTIHHPAWLIENMHRCIQSIISEFCYIYIIIHTSFLSSLSRTVVAPCSANCLSPSLACWS